MVIVSHACNLQPFPTFLPTRACIPIPSLCLSPCKLGLGKTENLSRNYRDKDQAEYRGALQFLPIAPSLVEPSKFRVPPPTPPPVPPPLPPPRPLLILGWPAFPAPPTCPNLPSTPRQLLHRCPPHQP